MKKLFFLLVLALLPFSASAETIVLYHTSDAHGFYYPRKGTGGFAALASVVKSEKRPYLLLDSGDFANGTVEAKESKGLTSIRLMNALGYNAAAVGNHEFDFSDEGVEPMLGQAQFAVLAANLFEKETGKRPAWLKPYQIFKAGGVKVAVIGLANRKPTKPTKKYQFSKPLDALESALASAGRENPDVVVVLVHDSLGDYKNGVLAYMGDIGKKFPGRVHIVLGGHAHKIFQNEYVGKTLYAESGCYLQNVTRVTVETDDKTGKFVSAKSELVPLEIKKTGKDKEIDLLAESLRVPGVDDVIGEAKETLSNRAQSPAQDSALDNWAADLGRAYTGSDFYIHNTGGTRVELEKGPVTRRDLIDVFPFDDALVRFSVDGKTLRNFIKKGLLPWNKYTYSGLKITYRRGKNGKVRGLKIWVNGKPLENNKTYTAGTNSYVAGHKAFSLLKKETAGDKTVRCLMEDALKKGASAPDTGRILRR